MEMRYQNIPEEELKNKVARDYFAAYNCTKIIGKVDFCVMSALPPTSALPPKGEVFREQSLLWAEAKANKHDVIAMFAQLILTIGKARTFDKNLPPAFLGAFDAEKIAFVEYGKVQHLFYQSDFNWNVAPSNHRTKEFAEIKSLINGFLESEKHLYVFGKDDGDLRFFIQNNLAKATVGQKIRIDKNNFVPVYLRWLDEIKPLIDFDFAKAQAQNILDSDFYLADLFVDDNDTNAITDDRPIKEDIFVVFRDQKYEITKENLSSLFDATIKLRDKAKYQQFWARYKRPPVAEFQDYIIKRRDLLVPQDVRERKGAFFTPKKWVELSQKYIADVLGEDWQDEYYVWDCAAGTGNLLAGLVNKRNIYASTLDQGDVSVMHERIKNGANLFENHVFQFDFLNDDFFDSEESLYDENGKKVETRTRPSKLPKTLQEIIKDPKKRKKLLVYINPPYAEATTARTFAGTGANKSKTATDNRTYRKYRAEIGNASKELFTQFLIRIYREIPNSKIANFSTLKNLQSSNFSDFRKKFRAKLEKIFLIPANTFDNVIGKFPIGFFVWNTDKKEDFTQIVADVYDENGNALKSKTIHSYGGNKRINQWLGSFHADGGPKNGTECTAYMEIKGTDFQNNNALNISSQKGTSHSIYFCISLHNLIPSVVYFSVRHCISATWLNDRDQFLWPNDSWQGDTEFHSDCLAFTLFHSQNRITAKDSTNHWIPFAEDEVRAREGFSSTFMTGFIAGKIKRSNGNGNIFNPPKTENGIKRTFSKEAVGVFDAGRQIWKHYHAQKGTNTETQIDFNVNASLYDIREYFQGRNGKGRMNSSSTDGKYTELIGNLREKQRVLAEKIAVKVYEHGFLRK